MKITYICHSCFTVEFDHSIFIFDYYSGQLPEWDKGKAIYVCSSHAHFDHYNEKIFTLSQKYERVTYVLSDDIMVKKRFRQPYAEQIITVAPNKEYEFDHIRLKTLKSTDEGVAFFITYEGKNIYHAGDLNWWHWEEETEAYNNQMAIDYQKQIALIEGALIEAAFLPLDPRLNSAYDWGFHYFMEHTRTKTAFPMHFWGKDKTVRRLKESEQGKGYGSQIAAVEREGQEWVLEEVKDEQ